MTPEQLELIATTGEAVSANPGSFAACFYQRLFEVAPQTRDMFQTEMRDQETKLVAEFAFLVDAATDVDAFVASARALGKRHAGYGVSEEHYEPVRVALVAALETACGDKWTEASAEAWGLLYALISETMMDGAAGELYADS